MIYDEWERLRVERPLGQWPKNLYLTPLKVPLVRAAVIFAVLLWISLECQYDTHGLFSGTNCDEVWDLGMSPSWDSPIWTRSIQSASWPDMSWRQFEDWSQPSSFERFHASSPPCSLGLCSSIRKFLVFLRTDSARTIFLNCDCISHHQMRGSFCCLVLWLVASQHVSISMERSVEHLAFPQSTCEISLLKMRHKDVCGRHRLWFNIN